MSDKETIAVYDDEVDKYAKVVSTDTPHKMLQLFASKLGKSDKVLDLGCGPANFSAWMRDQGLDVDPVDASSEMVRHANDTYDINARVGMFDDLDATDHYDGVWASFSLLHAAKQDFPRHLHQIHTALKPNGIFYIGMKLGEQAKRDELGRLYSYYQEDELKKYLEKTGFSITDSSTDEGVGLSGKVSAFIEIICVKT
ncbi:MAG: class I SAM-dependent methyltransferase [Pseudomonadota bacterium]